MRRITKISTVGMSREDWLAERRKSLGGSDVGAILGLNRWRSPYSVWADKRGLLPDEPENEAMRTGRDLEPYVLQRFREASGLKTRRVNAIIRNSDFPHLHANVDSMVVGQSAGVEAKTASALNTRLFRGAEFPGSYYAQCVTYLAVTEAVRWYLAVLIMGREFKIYQLTRIQSDTCPDWCESSVYVPQDELDALAMQAARFWQMVEAGTPPPVDGAQSTTEALDAIYSDDEDTEADLADLHDDVAALIAVQDRIKALKAVADGYKNIIKDRMQTATRGASALATVTWRTQLRRTLDVKRLAADHPEIEIANYYNTSKSRVFKLTPAKKEGESNE